MIISASRRTDIPAFYSDWFLNRLKEGYVYTKNPMNLSQVKKIQLDKNTVDCIVFWTKDPKNMLLKLDEIENLGFKYYFQFTLTPYDNSIERNLRRKEDIADTFIKLSEKIGKNRVLWRYDPIIINESLDIDYHILNFEKYCKQLCLYTNSVTISFADLYKKLKTNILKEISEAEMLTAAKHITDIAKGYKFKVKACCEKTDFTKLGIEKASCIDKDLIERICGYEINVPKDKSQRNGCGCVKSVDIGAYNTCKNGCVYCYANYSYESVLNNCKRHDVNGEFLNNVDNV